MLHEILLGSAGPAAVGVVVGGAIAYDRLREPYRDPARPHAVVDQHTYSDACRRIQRLTAHGDVLGHIAHVRVLLTGMEQWLHGEIHTGPRRRKARRIARLDQVHMAKEQTALLLLAPGPQTTQVEATQETLHRIATLLRASRSGYSWRRGQH